MVVRRGSGFPRMRDGTYFTLMFAMLSLCSMLMGDAHNAGACFPPAMLLMMLGFASLLPRCWVNRRCPDGVWLPPAVLLGETEEP